MEGHENRAEHDAERAGQHRPQRRQTQARADKTDGDGEEVEIAEKPEWPLAAEFGVTLVFRDVVDRAFLDQRFVTCTFVSDSHGSTSMDCSDYSLS
ncbi:hypothetical protein D1872_322580 [compost metagenome]